MTAIFYRWGRYDGDPHDAPKVGVGAIVFPDPSNTRSTGRCIIHGWDYYLLKGDTWMGVNGEVDLIDHVLHEIPDLVLKGRMFPKDVWERILREASQAQGFPRRSAVDPGFEDGGLKTNRDGVTHGPADS